MRSSHVSSQRKCLGLRVQSFELGQTNCFQTSHHLCKQRRRESFYITQPKESPAVMSSNLGFVSEFCPRQTQLNSFTGGNTTPICPSRHSFARAMRRASSYRHFRTVRISRWRASMPSVGDVSVILLAGGSGSRMKADRPKQFLRLAGMTVVEHSLFLFGNMTEVKQLVLVLDKQYRSDFEQHAGKLPCDFVFADPGKERQDSVYNGLLMVPSTANLACVHDSARPLVSTENIRAVLRDAAEHGAAVLGVPSKATIKESADGQFVLRTIPRSRLWEIQTPQVVKPALLMKGFEKVKNEGLAVTDDVSIVEQLGEPVKITMGEYTNIKLTTPEDMNIAESILQERRKSNAVV